MGVGKQQGKATIDAIKADPSVTNKQHLRNQIADAITILQVKLYALDMQLNQAASDFAVSKQTQYDNFVNALPDVGDPTVVSGSVV